MRSDHEALPCPRGHRLLDHTSEIILKVWGPTFGDLLGEAGAAFAELVPDTIAAVEDPAWRTFTLTDADGPAMLVGWLNELVFLAEAERWVPTEIEVRMFDDATGRVRARGRRLERPFVLVKAATLHGLEITKGEDGLEAEVTLDV